MPKPAPLADRVAVNAGVRADRFAGSVYDLAAGWQFARAVFVIEIAVNKFRILAVGHKADLLRLLLFGGV